MLFKMGGKRRQAHNNEGSSTSAGYKDLMFDIFPDLLKGVGLGFFKPSFEQVVEQIKRKKLISN